MKSKKKLVVTIIVTKNDAIKGNQKGCFLYTIMCNTNVHLKLCTDHDSNVCEIQR